MLIDITNFHISLQNKKAKESPEGFETFMLDITLIIVIVIIDIGIFVMRVVVVQEYKKYNYSTSTSQEMTMEDRTEAMILTYQAENFEQLTGTKNQLNAIKKDLLLI